MSKKGGAKQSGRRWVHPSSALTNGHVVYNVKLIGQTEVENPKGAEVVREAVRKLKFNRQLKRADGEKPAKVELTISTMGVAIQDRQTKVRLHTFPLHRISYCADDKQDKRICAFVCKEEVSNKNVCFVIDSEKCAEEITLTVGQAFDLAYQQFMQTSGKEMGMQKQMLSLQKKVQELETDNIKLRMRVVELEAQQGQQPPPYTESNTNGTQPTLHKDLLGSPSQLPPPVNQFESELLRQQNTPPPSGAVPFNASPPAGAAATTGPMATSQTQFSSEAEFLFGSGSGNVNGVTLTPSNATVQSPAGTTVTSRPRPHGVASPVGQVPSLAPPPPTGRNRRGTTGASPVTKQDSTGSTGSLNDRFGQAPFSQNQPLSVARSNPFLSGGSSQDLAASQHYQELQEGFASGLTIGNEDLSLADLDPLNNLSSC